MKKLILIIPLILLSCSNPENNSKQFLYTLKVKDDNGSVDTIKAEGSEYQLSYRHLIVGGRYISANIQSVSLISKDTIK